MSQPYKFDPMDFETNWTYFIIFIKRRYKFDPMDFETFGSIGKNQKQRQRINLILWILKQFLRVVFFTTLLV